MRGTQRAKRSERNEEERMYVGVGTLLAIVLIIIILVLIF
jgi:hypothetical protein